MKNVIIISSLLAVVACKTETPKEVKLEKVRPKKDSITSGPLDPKPE